MAPEKKGAGAEPGAGLFVVGAVVGSGPGKAWGDPPAQPWNVTLLVGARLYVVEYADESSAEHAFGDGLVGLIAARAQVSVRVFPRLAGNRAAREKVWIAYGGERDERS